MDPRVTEILRKGYLSVVGIERDAEGKEHFAAWLLDLPGCVAQGETREQARERLDAIKPPYIAKLLELNVTIPEPTTLPAVIPGLAWFYDQTGRARQTQPAELPEPEVYGTGWLHVVAA
jgi:predicted RNase H-like HicB family nuclease